MVDDPVKTDYAKAHLNDLCRAARRGCVRYSRFLEPPAGSDARSIAKKEGAELTLWGGYEGAERKIAAFWMTEPPEEWPIDCLKICWHSDCDRVEHRDILGALMGLGIDRSLLGDIRIGDGCAFLFVERSASAHVLSQLSEIGRAHVHVERSSAEALPEEDGEPIRCTVMSPRLDAIVAAGFSLGRSQAQAMIVRGLVKHNFLQEIRPDARVGAGDILSVRGYGRLRIEAEMGLTKKGRQCILIMRFGRS